MSKKELWLKIYLARVQGGESHNEAVVAANNDVDFVMIALDGQSSLDDIVMKRETV